MCTITIYAEDESAYFRIQALVEKLLTDSGIPGNFVWIHHDGLYPDIRGSARAVVFNASNITLRQLIAVSESVGALVWKRGNADKYYLGNIYV